MTQGTNDYNASKLSPSEKIVSRTLQSKNRFWSNVIWRSGKPALDSEWNLINDLNFENMSNTIKGMVPSGWLDIGSNLSVTNSNVANNFKFYANKDQQILDIPNAVVNGWPILVGGVNSTDTSINSVNLTPASALIDGAREDFVFLEVWRAQVRSRDENNNPITQNKPSTDKIYAYGNTQFGGTHFDDDIIDTVIKPPTGLETSERVQIQYRIRVVPGVSIFNTSEIGFESVNVQGQGANPNPQVVGYSFSNMASELNDPGLWRSGDGDEASRLALRSVDGYSYAIPMFRVYRRTQLSYADTSVDTQQGNASDITEISDRPDGKFHDGIDATDILDLRYKVSYDKEDFNKLIEENLHQLLSGELTSTRRKFPQYDAIYEADIAAYTDIDGNVGCSGKRTVWSDSPVEQDNLYAKVTKDTTSNALDCYRVANGGSAWQLGDQIKIKIISKYPAGTVVLSTPIIYLEKSGQPVITGQGTFTGLDTDEVTWTISSITDLSNLNFWIYYDISMPANQGLSQVPNTLFRVNYDNYDAFPEYSVVRNIVTGQEGFLDDNSNLYNLYNHPHNNEIGTTFYREVEIKKELKLINIRPLIQTTSTRDGTTRSLSVKTVSSKVVKVPFALQHLKGIYTSATGGLEVATQAVVTHTTITSLSLNTDEFLISTNNYICELTSFTKDNIELLGPGATYYRPVFTHKSDGTWMKLYNSEGTVFDIAGMSAGQFKWTGRKIAVGGSGYTINDSQIDCNLGDNASAITSNGQELWIDMDYLGAPHNGARMKIIYCHTPYQGQDVGNQELELLCKREKGLFFNNGTGGGLVDPSNVNATSNYYYSPMSPRLPGTFDDHLRDGSLISIKSVGNNRFTTDAFFNATYDLYASYGGGKLWNTESYLLPALPTGDRGFIVDPFLEAIFEDPETDQTNAAFVLPLLVIDKNTKEVYLLIQIDRDSLKKGIHKNTTIYLDIFKLKNRLLCK